MNRLLPGLLLLAACSSEPRVLTAEVDVAVGRTVLTTSGDVMALSPGWSLRGLISLRDLLPGERITVTWTRRRAGVILADVVLAQPVVRIDPVLEVRTSELERLLGASEATVVDSRDRAAFAAGHLPGAVSRPSNATTLPSSPVVFYGAGPRDELAAAALRAALAGGHESARAYLGAIPAWERSGHFTVMEVDHLARIAGDVLLVDVRDSHEIVSGTITGAHAMPVADLEREQLANEAWMPPMVFFGSDAADERATLAARRAVAWRYRDANGPHVPVHLLNGGLAAWKQAGHSIVSGKNAPSRFVHVVDDESGQLTTDAFRELVHDPGKTLLLDVRSPSTASHEWATHVALEELPSRLDELPRDRPIVAFCNFGKRSRIAQVILKRNGFDVRYLRARPPL